MPDSADWLRFATEDLETLRNELRDRDAPPRTACFNAQQAAEKLLKAVLVAATVEFPRTHDLDLLRTLLPPLARAACADADLSTVSAWAVASRYPADLPEASWEDAANAEQVVSGLFVALGSHLSGKEPTT